MINFGCCTIPKLKQGPADNKNQQVNTSKAVVIMSRLTKQVNAQT